MKKVFSVLVTSIVVSIVAVGCAKSADESVLPSSIADPDSSSTDSIVTDPILESDEKSLLEKLAEVVCSNSPNRMDSAAEVYTDESWNCSYGNEQVRIDLYTDEQQMDRAAQATLDFYASMGDNRTLGDLPVICGENWNIGIDFNETRDALIDALVAVGIAATTC